MKLKCLRYERWHLLHLEPVCVVGIGGWSRGSEVPQIHTLNQSRVSLSCQSRHFSTFSQHQKNKHTDEQQLSFVYTLTKSDKCTNTHCPAQPDNCFSKHSRMSTFVELQTHVQPKQSTHTTPHTSNAHTCAQLKSTFSEASDPETTSRGILCPSSEMWTGSQSRGPCKDLEDDEVWCWVGRVTCESAAACPVYLSSNKDSDWTPSLICWGWTRGLSTFNLEGNRCQYIHNTDTHTHTQQTRSIDWRNVCLLFKNDMLRVVCERR